VATAVGAVLVVAQLTRAVHQARERGRDERREHTITIYLETLDSRRKIKGDELPDDRDAEAISELIDTLLSAEQEGQEREPEIASARRALTQYLSFWEAVALGVKQGVFDFETLRMQAAGHVQALWANYEPWIRSRGEKYGAPLYEHLRWLAESFRLGRPLGNR